MLFIHSLQEDLSDESDYEEADSAGPVKWVVPAVGGTRTGTGSGQRGREGRVEVEGIERWSSQKIQDGRAIFF
jgi:hypothetical protein